MPKYTIKALEKLNHPTPRKPTHSTHRWVTKIYGAKQIFYPQDDDTPTLSPQEAKRIEKVVGLFLYYTRGVDNIIHPAINEISITQSNSPEMTQKKSNKLLDYLHTHLNAKIRYFASSMQIYIDSDAAYLVAPKAKNRVAGYVYLSEKP